MGCERRDEVKVRKIKDKYVFDRNKETYFALTLEQVREMQKLIDEILRQDNG